ncbi:MAG: mechanosensitive ion channel [Candidatus Omnitrophota bacterium]|nr:mechanosensitive ion channel [Candidatus Omnitrophota bacterium]
MNIFAFELSLITWKFVVSVVSILIIYLLTALICRIINRKVDDIKKKYNARKTTFYVATLLMLLCLSFIWIENFSKLTVVLSVLGAGLVFALQELILCIAGWFVIIFKKPFDSGDRIEINGVKGDVIDINFLQSSFLEIGSWVGEDQSTGRVVHIPNSMVFRHAVYNYTRDFEFIWNEIKIVVTFESNWKRAKEIILNHAQEEADRIKQEVDRLIRKMATQYLIYYEKLTPIVYVKIVGHGVELSLRYLTEAKRRRSTQDEISKKILGDFEKEGHVNFAYDTLRIVK